MEKINSHQKLAKQLILDELLDLTLYRRLHEIAKNRDTRIMLASLMEIEQAHLAFWQDHFHLPLNTLDWKRKLKISIIIAACRVLGESAIHLSLEAIEIYGIRKYLTLWEHSRNTPMEESVHTILEDEFKHEDEIVSQYTTKNISPERIRSVFLGFNDGLVEILGAVSGFFAAFQQTRAVLIAGLTVAVAGAISMAAGAYAAANSENEVRSLENGKARFLKKNNIDNNKEEPPFSTASIVGMSYFIGAAFPIIPVFLGATSPLPSILFAGLAIILISIILAFLSGMKTKSRILTNIATIVFAVGISYAIGFLVRTYFGITI